MKMPRLVVPEMYYNGKKSKKFHEGATGKLSVFLESDNKGMAEKFESFCEDLFNVCKKNRMKISHVASILNQKALENKLLKIKKQVAESKENERECIVIVSNEITWITKSICYEQRLGIPIQVVSKDLVQCYDAEALRALSMKINITLGGVNYEIRMKSEDIFNCKDAESSDDSTESLTSENDLIVAFNARKFTLPEFFAQSYDDKCKDVWTIGWSANYVDGKPMTFVSNCNFMQCRSYNIGRRLDYDEILREILRKKSEKGRPPKRIFIIFTFEDLIEPLPLYGTNIRRLKETVSEFYEKMPIAILSYNKEPFYKIPEGSDTKFGRVLKMQKFFGRNSSTDIRFIDSLEGLSTEHPQIARICTMAFKDMEIGFLELAQVIFNLYFCHQTADCLVNPIPAPIRYAIETAKRSKEVFLYRVNKPKSDTNPYRIIQWCDEKFTYGPKSFEKTGLSEVSFAF